MPAEVTASLIAVIGTLLGVALSNHYAMRKSREDKLKSVVQMLKEEVRARQYLEDVACAHIASITNGNERSIKIELRDIVEQQHNVRPKLSHADVANR